jgi:hypothetical protein
MEKQNNMKRLTVHLAEVKPITLETNKFVWKHKGETFSDKDKAPKEAKRVKLKKTVLNNTITVRDLQTDKDIQDALSAIRSKYTIAICPDSRKSNWKSGEEMYHIANQK